MLNQIHEEDLEQDEIMDSLVIYRARKKAIESLPKPIQQAHAWKYITDYGYY